MANILLKAGHRRRKWQILRGCRGVSLLNKSRRFLFLSSVELKGLCFSIFLPNRLELVLGSDKNFPLLFPLLLPRLSYQLRKSAQLFMGELFCSTQLMPLITLITLVSLISHISFIIVCCPGRGTGLRFRTFNGKSLQTESLSNLDKNQTNTFQ